MFRLLLGYAAMRGLPDDSGLSNKIFVHHSTLSQSRNGRSMSWVALAKPVQVHLIPERPSGAGLQAFPSPVQDCKVLSGKGLSFTAGG